MQLLKDLLDKWVPPGQVDQASLAAQILLEQFIKDLDNEMQLWVCWHLPKMAEEALRVAEDFMASEVKHVREKSYKSTGMFIKREEEP